jgi:DNA repair protein RecN (Recombination protein N)
MLRELRIRDYALIDDLSVSFAPGLNVLTGETGAGKSIILGALSLLLGDKPDPDMIRSGADSAQVEGQFDLSPAVAGQCRDLGIEPDPDREPRLIVRRRAERAGRSAAYANDSGLTVAALQKLGDRLVDLHGQHQHQLLLRPEVHLDILDEYAGLRTEREEFAGLFASFEAARDELATLDKELAERRARRDLTEFQHRELADARVKPGEAEELRREQELSRTIERRFVLVRQLEGLLSEQEGSIISLLSAAAKNLGELADLDPNLAGHKATVGEAAASADDLWRELVRYRDTLEFSPERMEELNNRLFLIEKLERKYAIPASSLPELEAGLKAELESIQTGDSRREELVARAQSLKKKLAAGADSLSRRRVKAAKELEARLKTEFEALGLGRAELSVSIGRTPDPEGAYSGKDGSFRLASTGVDSVEFLFCANPGEELKPLRKVASGGELSRVMLGLKGALAQADPVSTLVFDEIDTGIGGKVAEAVGRRLSRISRNHQVVCITHLPQIAKYAEQHLLVTKSSRAGRVLTGIRILTDEERVEELARMTSGATVTRASLAHAREMLESAGARGD